MDRYLYQFEKLQVWQKGKLLNRKIYKLTTSFPNHVDYALKSQIQRACVSICANIAEGSGRRKGREQGQYFKTSYSSAIELLNHILLCIDLELISEKEFIEELRPLIESITRQINALYKSTMSSENGIPK